MKKQAVNADLAPVIEEKDAPSAPVQSADVGNTPRTRRRKVREIQGLKQVMKVHLNKLANDLR